MLISLFGMPCFLLLFCLGVAQLHYGEIYRGGKAALLILLRFPDRLLGDEGRFFGAGWGMRVFYLEVVPCLVACALYRLDLLIGAPVPDLYERVQLSGQQ